MAPMLWFSKKTVRKIQIRSFGVLVGKAPTKEKRIKILVTMPITGHKLTGFPEWLADARDFTMKTGQPVKPIQTIPYCNVVMNDEENLFFKTPIEAPKAKLSHFSVENMGTSDDPTTVIKFQMIAPFSTDLCRWCGQMAGEEFDSQYEVTEGPVDEEEEEAEDDALKGETGDDEDSPSAQEKRRVAKAKKKIQLI